LLDQWQGSFVVWGLLNYAKELAYSALGAYNEKSILEVEMGSRKIRSPDLLLIILGY